MTALTSESAVPALIRQLANAALDTRALRNSAAATQLDEITLLPHQDAAVRWLARRLDRFGGALLADPPGLGKTYVALAVARVRRVTPLVIAPASLRERWRLAARETGVAIDFVSTERLSAPAPITLAPRPLVIIDEAHHLRTPHTRRHQRTSNACHDADVLLLSATPVHNGTADLEHLTTLFHLSPTRASITTLRRRLTLRRSLAQVQAAGSLGDAMHLPHVQHHRPFQFDCRHEALVQAVLALPPLRPADRDEGHPLLLVGLLHALRSSDAAACQRIRSRIAATVAIEQSVAAGVEPTTAVRRAWHALGTDVQLAMPLLLADTASPPDPALIGAAIRQRDALLALLPALDGAGDVRRATVLRRLARWCSRPVVAFTWSAATAAALYRHLRLVRGIALLSGAGGRIASGAITRAELLQRLLAGAGMPRAGGTRARHAQAHAHGHAHTHEREGIRLLITTDVISEGLSLAGVATIVHLDQPWTPARIDQRIGRAARIGAPVSEVRVVTLEAPLPRHAHAAMAALLARKRHAMHDLEPGGNADDDTVLCLIQLARRQPPQSMSAGGARGSTARGSALRWATLASVDVDTPLIIAIVSLHRRRQLVVLQRSTLRAPALRDWHALTPAQPLLHGDDVGGQVRHLRQALHAYLADRELRGRVRAAGDARLCARHRVDETLLSGRWQARLGQAAVTSNARRQLMQITRPGDLAALVRATARDSDTGARNTTERATGAARARTTADAVRIHAGIVLVPAALRPEEGAYIATQ